MNGPEAAAMIIMTVFAGVGGMTWLTLHYRNRGAVKPAELAAIEARLQRIEQAVDAIALEAERIAEGQRFTTKLLSERAGTGSAR